MNKRLLTFAAILALAISAAAQTRVITLGTQGGPAPSLQRAQPANAVVVRDRIYLIDAGNGVTRQLRAAGLDLRRIDNIFITHNHDDHNADWGTLMGFQWSLGRQTETHVYGPGGTETMLQGYLQYFAPNTRIRQADQKTGKPPQDLFRAHDIAGSGLVFKDDLVTVTAVANCHYHGDPTARPRNDQDKSFSLRFQTPDMVVVFSGDTGRCAALPEFVRDAGILVHEVIDLPLMRQSMGRFLPPPAVENWMRHMAQDHTEAEDVGRLAQAGKVKKVVLTHILPGMDEPDSVYVERVRKHFDGPVFVAKDLMSF